MTEDGEKAALKHHARAVTPAGGARAADIRTYGAKGGRWDAASAQSRMLGSRLSPSIRPHADAPSSPAHAGRGRILAPRVNAAEDQGGRQTSGHRPSERDSERPPYLRGPTFAGSLTPNGTARPQGVQGTAPQPPPRREERRKKDRGRGRGRAGKRGKRETGGGEGTVPSTPGGAWPRQGGLGVLGRGRLPRQKLN